MAENIAYETSDTGGMPPAPTPAVFWRPTVPGHDSDGMPPDEYPEVRYPGVIGDAQFIANASPNGYGRFRNAVIKFLPAGTLAAGDAHIMAADKLPTLTWHFHASFVGGVALRTVVIEPLSKSRLGQKVARKIGFGIGLVLGIGYGFWGSVTQLDSAPDQAVQAVTGFTLGYGAQDVGEGLAGKYRAGRPPKPKKAKTPAVVKPTSAARA